MAIRIADEFSSAASERPLEATVFSAGLARVKTVFDSARIGTLRNMLFAGEIPNIVERAERPVPEGLDGHDLAVGYDAVNGFFYATVRAPGKKDGEVRINVDPDGMRAWVFLNAGEYNRMLHADSGVSAGEPCPQEYEAFARSAMDALSKLSDEHYLKAVSSPALNGLTTQVGHGVDSALSGS